MMKDLVAKNRRMAMDNCSRRVESNSEWLQRLMEYPQTGPMVQMVVMNAVQEYAKDVVELAKDPVKWARFREAMGGDNGFVNPESWLASCKEIHAASLLKSSSPRYVYMCSVCRDNLVDAEAGEDTCSECARIRDRR
jgi:hypothetical protein